MGVARHQPIVAERRRETAAAAALETIVLKRRLVRSRGDSARVGDDLRPKVQNIRNLHKIPCLL